MATQFSLETIKKAYITFYGRPADDNGLLYWAERLDEAGTSGMNDVIEEFGDSTEFTERYSENSNTDLINNIYQQAFSRDADDEGLAFYVERLESGEASLANIALQIMNSAQGDDAQVLQKKIEVGDLLVAQTQEEGRVYTGNAVATAVSELLSEVTLDSPSAQEHVTAFNDITDRMAYSQNSYQPEALEEGYQKREEQDLDRDGFVDIVKISTYDDQGRLIRADEDTNGDGITDQVFQWQYGEFGNIVRHEVDTDNDGQANYIATSTYRDNSASEVSQAYQVARDNYQQAYYDYWLASGLYNIPDFSEENPTFNLYAPDELTEEHQALYDAYKTAYDAFKEIRQTSILEDEDFYVIFEFDRSAPEAPSSAISSEENTTHHLSQYQSSIVNQTIDSDGDGEADYTLDYQYDDQGNLLSIQLDNNGDGQIDYAESKEYDSYNRLITQELDSDGDGQDNFIATYQYRTPEEMANDVAFPNTGITSAPISSNTLTRRTLDHYGDGQINSSDSYQYNEKGWIIRYEKDNNGDGQPNSTINYGYDAAGYITLVETDDNGDGLYEMIEQAEFNDAGIQIHYERQTDSNNDGTMDALYAREWDDIGQLISTYGDSNLDGEWDYITTYAYDERGNKILYKSNSDTSTDESRVQYYTYNELNQRTVIETDHTNDGVIDVIDYTSFDAFGFVDGQKHDYDADGVIDSYYEEIITNEGGITRTENITDGKLTRSKEEEREDGKLIRVSKDSDGDGEFDHETFFSYNENGNRAKISVDNNGDGIIDSESYFGSDENGNLLFSKSDLDVDGILDSASSYTYDIDGNRNSYKREYDYNDDGQIDFSQTYQYAPNGDVILIGTYGSDTPPPITVSDSETIYLF